MEASDRILFPQYIKKFKCNRNCEKKCCSYLEALIKDDLYLKLKRVEKLEIKKHIEESLVEIPFNVDYESCAKVKKDVRGRCTLLGEDGLCYLHKNLGAEYLPETCRSYPRVYNMIDGKVEASGSFSCVEVARLALLKEKPMEFDEEELLQYRYSMKFQFNTKDNRYGNKVHRYFWPLRIFTIGLLQNRDYRLWERVTILGLFYRRLQNNVEAGMVNATEELIGEYNKMLEEGTFRKKLQVIAPGVEPQILLIKNMDEMKATKNPEFEGLIEEFFQGLQYKEDGKISYAVARYKEAYEKYYEPFIKEKEYILENLLINYVFINTFPISQEYEVFDNYINLVVYYAGIKGLLIGIAAQKGEVNEKLIIEIISCFSRAIECDKVLHYRMQDDLKAKRNNTMGFMTALIKN